MVPVQGLPYTISYCNLNVLYDTRLYESVASSHLSESLPHLSWVNLRQVTDPP